MSRPIRHRRVEDRQVEVVVRSNQANLIDVGSNQGQSGQRGGADRKAFSGSSGGVAQRVQGVGAVANLFAQAGHLCDAARVVRNRTVSVGGQGDAQGGQHADCRQRYAVQAGVEVSRAAADKK